MLSAAYLGVSIKKVMQESEFKIYSLVDLMKVAYHIGKHWERRWSPNPMKFWFRGVDNHAWCLNPGLLRGEMGAEEARKLEYQIGVDFRVRARPYLQGPVNSPWEAMFLMQHYGFPTRLLDWSENLVAAAYFATRDIRSSSDGAVWMLAPQALIEGQFGIEGSVHISSNHPLAKEYTFGGPWEDFEQFNEMQPIPILPDHLDKRIIAQTGRFTIHTFRKNQLQKLVEEDAKAHEGSKFLHKLVIPSEAKANVRQQCRMFGGVSEEALFPDLDGLARAYKWELQEGGILP